MTKKAKKAHLLIVDDDPNMIKLVKFYLSKENAQIDESLNGKTALRMIEDNNYDLILIDILMPEMDGKTLLQKIRIDLKIEVPVIVLTAHGVTDDLIDLLHHGVYDILQKPFTANRLRLTIHNALQYKQLSEKYRYLLQVIKQEKQAK